MSAGDLARLNDLLSDNPVGITAELLPGDSSVGQREFGWPFRVLALRSLTLRSTVLTDELRRGMAATGQRSGWGPPMIVELVGVWWDRTGLLPRADAYWPAKPLWPGLIGNTFFWALVFASPLLVRRVNNLRRQRLRRRAGLCPTCAYNLAGLAAGTPCPECAKSLATGASSGSERVPTRGQV